MFRAVFLASLAMTTPAVAQSLAQPGKSWVQVASTRDLNTAIGIARLFPTDGAGRVVTTSDGSYAVILGPVATTTIEAYRATWSAHNAKLPADAVIIADGEYAQTVWQQPPEPPELDLGTNPAAISAGGLTVVAEIAPADKYDGPALHLTGSDAHGTLFDVYIGSDEPDPHSPTASIVRLDNSTRCPQVVVSQYTGGPHCCTDTTILTEVAQGKWTQVDGYSFYGGYSFEDVDGDGAAELLSIDESFMYFDGRLDGPTPIFVHKLSGTTITDVTRSPMTRDRYLQELAGIEFSGEIDPTRWHDNQFLADWVTTSAILGQLPDAWTKAMPLYDHSIVFHDYCAAAPGQECVRTFADELALLLDEYGYGDPTTLPTPRLRPASTR